MTHGTAGNETPGWDYNGNEIGNTLNGLHTTYTYDDEDRLVSATGPGYADTFTYNGLGLRVGKTDSTGTYSYFCDGASPGSPVLSDGHATYTPGLSESRGGVSSYAASDVLGNLWFMDNSAAAQTYYQDTTAFGVPSAIGGTEAGPFKFGGANGCQTDADTGFVLMGHRYYDTRIGRFISQDPAGAGNNWYAYAGNNPVSEIDPTGLDGIFGDFGLGASSAHAVEPISSARAFANMGLNRSSSLVTAYQYYSVDLVTWNTKTGAVISSVHEFNFAVPTGVDITLNYQQALSDRDPYAYIHKSQTEAYFRGSKGNGIAQGTSGDYKEGKLPSDLSPRLKKELVKLLDHGGNFNGGMVAEGYGTLAIENPLIGAYAKSSSDQSPQLDDFTGQGIFNAGWNYASQGDSTHW